MTITLDPKAALLAATLRPRVMVVPFMIYSSVIVTTDSLSVMTIVFGWLVLVCAYGVAVIQNDFADQEVDRINERRDIPLAQNLVGEKELVYLFALVIVIGSMASLLLGGYVLLWFASLSFLSWLYSGPFLLKNKSYPTLIVLGWCYGVMPWLLGMIVASIALDVPKMSIMSASFLFVAAIISLKDFKDEKGDRLSGKNTLLVTKGHFFVGKFMVILSTFAYMVVVVTVLYSARHSIILAVIGISALLVNLQLLRTRLLSQSYQRAQLGVLIRGLFFGYAIVVFWLS